MIGTPKAARRSAPEGMRWATGGGDPIGDCNGYHLARGLKMGTLCGRFGPHTPAGPPLAQPICRTCARIAKVPAALDGDDTSRAAAQNQRQP